MSPPVINVLLGFTSAHIFGTTHDHSQLSLWHDLFKFLVGLLLNNNNNNKLSFFLSFFESSNSSYETGPTPVVEHGGFVWRAMERLRPPFTWGVDYEAVVISAPADADLVTRRPNLF